MPFPTADRCGIRYSLPLFGLIRNIKLANIECEFEYIVFDCFFEIKFMYLETAFLFKFMWHRIESTNFSLIQFLCLLNVLKLLIIVIYNIQHKFNL